MREPDTGHVYFYTMDAVILQTYESLPAEVKQAIDRIIAECGKQHLSPSGNDNRPFASLPGLGSMPGIWMADDFDETPEDFKDYM